MEQRATSVADEGPPDGDEGTSGIDIMFKPDLNNAGQSGYLYKMTRDGRWQRRWFETNGIFLTYYKSRKREKLLAALSLQQVGEIKTIEGIDSDPELKVGLFTIQLNTRVYTLRAKDNEEAISWVTALCRIKTENPEISTTHSPLQNKTNPDRKSASSAPKDGWEKKAESSCCPCF